MLTARECARFMSFPDSYLLPESHKLAVHMVGNSVAPPQARFVLESVRDFLAA